MALWQSFDKEYNILILFSKRGQNFNQKLFDNQTPALTKQESKLFPDRQRACRLCLKSKVRHMRTWHSEVYPAGKLH